MKKWRIESDSLGKVKVPSTSLWGAQTQRSLEHFSIGTDLMPRELITAYAILKKAAAMANHRQKRLPKAKRDLIIRVCEEILKGEHEREFPLHVWMTGSGTQFNMNVNEVIANRSSQIARKMLGSKKPIHPNDDVNMSQSSNDSFPSAMNIAAALKVKETLLPALTLLQKTLHRKAEKWEKIVKLGRTHLQDATPITLGQEFSGYAALLEAHIEEIEASLEGVYALALGGTAVGTGINTVQGFDKLVASYIAKLTKLAFISAKNKFAVQGSHNGLIALSGALRNLAISLYKIANDIRLLSCGPRAGFYELLIPANEPGSSIMPGKVNPTQCEALCMVALQVMANDMAAAFGNASGYLEMNVYKPLIIYNVLHSVRLLSDAVCNFEKFLVRGIKPNLKRIKADLDNSLMLVTALSPTIGYDKASKIAHYALDHDIKLKEAALTLGFVTEEEFDRIVNPLKMCHPAKKIGPS
ncbi:MAG: class II fumarate hydratase [Verrucomicrobia bacterium]|nr:class II fumarate hydratase [Verrucomicrobiota bacterium]